MKKFTCVIVAIAVVVGLAMFLPTKRAEFDYLRLQICANSNSAIDQGVKYQIQERLVDYLTPYLSSAKNKEDAIKIANDVNLSLVNVCKSVLNENNLKYAVKIKVEKKFFEQTQNFKSGEYDTLVVELGSGNGNNENCLIYPPLNVGNKKEVKFKSKILNWLKTIF